MRKEKKLRDIILIRIAILIVGTIFALIIINSLSTKIARKYQIENIKYISELIKKDIQLINDVFNNDIIIEETLKNITKKIKSVEAICILKGKKLICSTKSFESVIKGINLKNVKGIRIERDSESNTVLTITPIYEEYASQLLTRKQQGYLIIKFKEDFFKHFRVFWLYLSLVSSVILGIIGISVGLSLYYSINGNFRLLQELIVTLQHNLGKNVRKKTEEIIKSIKIKELKELAKLIVSFKEKISELNERIRYLALKDSLTNLYNRNYLELVLKQGFINLWKREKFPLSVVIIDIDNFKKINDTFGHNKGDEVLRKLGEIIGRYIRKGDIPIRYGGEEFLIIFPYTTKEIALNIVNRIKRKFSEIDFGINQKLTFSAGIAGYPDDIDQPGKIENLIKIADERLYKAKNTGKNKAVID